MTDYCSDETEMMRHYREQGAADERRKVAREMQRIMADDWGQTRLKQWAERFIREDEGE